MSTRYIVEHTDDTFPAGIVEEGDGYRITLGDETFLVDARSISGNATRSMIIDGQSFEIATMTTRDGTDVYVSGDVFRVKVVDELWARAAEGAHAGASGKEQVVSPMPGAVVKILVAVGQVVAPGDTVAVVEAMKMQNDLTATQGGKVVEIRAAAGDVVEQDTVLVVLEAGDSA